MIGSPSSPPDGEQPAVDTKSPNNYGDDHNEEEEEGGKAAGPDVAAARGLAPKFRTAAHAQLEQAPSSGVCMGICECSAEKAAAATAAAAAHAGASLDEPLVRAVARASHDLDTYAADCVDSSLESRSSLSECTTIVHWQPSRLNVNGSSGGRRLPTAAAIAQEQQQQQQRRHMPGEGEGCGGAGAEGEGEGERQAQGAVKVVAAGRGSKGFVEEPIGGERVERDPSDLDSRQVRAGSSCSGVERARHCSPKFRDVSWSAPQTVEPSSAGTTTGK